VFENVHDTIVTELARDIAIAEKSLAELYSERARMASKLKDSPDGRLNFQGPDPSGTRGVFALCETLKAQVNPLAELLQNMPANTRIVIESLSEPINCPGCGCPVNADTEAPR
jgi:hypothetical protein